MIRECTNQPALFEGRVIVWFSCGAASAVLAKLASEKYRDHPAFEVVYCNTLASEHPDNVRFMADVSRWIGRRIKTLSHPKWATVDEVFAAQRYMSGPGGAPCTKHLKRLVRVAYQGPGDLHLFGYTAEEWDRIIDFEEHNPDLRLEWMLRDEGILKEYCFQIITDAGIRLPYMYELGFRNNNCIGCVKAQSPEYWHRTRVFFPEIFKRRCEQSRALKVRLVKLKGKRIFLDELPTNIKPGPQMEDVSCGPQCGLEPWRPDAELTPVTR